MRLLPRSLYGRLLALSAIATLLALGVAGLGVGRVLEGFVTRSLDQRLDDKLFALGSVVRRDGSIDATRIALFERTRVADEDWRVDAPRGHAATTDRGIAFDRGATLPAPDTYLRDGHRRGPPRHGPPDPLAEDRFGSFGSAPFDWRAPDGRWMHGRWRTIASDAGRATVAVAVPRALIDRPIRGALGPLLASLLILGVALALATLVQLRIGLAPLATLQRALADIRAGRAEQVPGGQPAELAPLAAELNALIAQNAAALAQARGHVANLAHGLKTPLATLALELEGRDPDGRLSTEVERIAGAVRHHLGRARAAAPGGTLRPVTALAPAIEGLVSALARIHAERGVAASLSIPPSLSVAVDAQDLDELVGNLLDNAWRWARTSVAVVAVADGATVRLSIADDGPGIPPAARAAALAPGRRLDEAGEGHGFGLSIARELAELHGGTLALGTAAAGGLDAVVVLPAGGTAA